MKKMYKEWWEITLFLLLCIHIFSNFLCFNLYKICNLWIVMSLFINSRIVRDLKRSGNYIVSMGNFIVSMGNYIVSSGSLICHIWHICQNLIFFSVNDKSFFQDLLKNIFFIFALWKMVSLLSYPAIAGLEMLIIFYWIKYVKLSFLLK